MKKPLHLLHVPVFLIFLCLSLQVNGQDQSCAYTLKQAQQLYQQGLIKDIPSMLQGCLDNGFTRKERQDAYKLIIQCYLYDDNHLAADSAMPRFLKKFHDYEISPTDPKEFVYLFNSYRNLPILSIGATFGINWTQVSLKESYQMVNTNGIPRKYKSGSIGIHYGIQFNTYIAPQIELGLAALIVTNKFSSTDSAKYDDQTTAVIGAAETETRYEFPVFARYNFKPVNKFTPFARLGIVPSYTNAVTVVLNQDFIGKAIQNNVPPVSYDIIGWRKQFGIWALAAVGIKYDFLQFGYFWLDVKYQLGFTPMKLNTDAIYANTDIGRQIYLEI